MASLAPTWYYNVSIKAVAEKCAYLTKNGEYQKAVEVVGEAISAKETNAYLYRLRAFVYALMTLRCMGSMSWRILASMNPGMVTLTTRP